ncbi:MAG: thioredoxin domain-containing protein [Phycisphaerae bacterium]
MTASTPHHHTNRLINATSPYLLQHAHNPVDWYEWGDAAFEAARAGDKPVFLSIGYAACHWCHVMAHESFETDEVADVLNEHFVSIKVDREERPDIDEIYMTYTQQRTGGGGWPMSVWLTPEGVPFFAGTYFPKDRFVGVLRQIAEVWKTRRNDIATDAANVRAFFAKWSAGPAPAASPVPRDMVEKTAAYVARYIDRTLGGFQSQGNKFPPSMAMELLLRAHRRTHDADLLEAVEVTLDHMARGGIYDHLGGGICRYSTDPQWLVPHFEKMLYDQALVSGIFLDAYTATRRPLYARTAGDILRYVMADLQSPAGGIYSTRDADSNGQEGAYYIWTVDEVLQILGPEDGKLFCGYYDVTETGNWFERLGHAPPGPKNILHVAKPADVFAKLHGLSTGDLNAKLATWREKVLAARANRTPPALDDKILTGWNGLMIASLAKGARVLDEPMYADAAARAADFVLRELERDGRLLRTHRAGKSRLMAYVTDYAFFVEGLLNLYEATFDRKWLDRALALTDTAIRYYHDDEGGAFFFTASDAEQLLARTKSPQDGAIPAGNSVMAGNLLRLAVLFDRQDLRDKAVGIFKAFAPMMKEPGFSFERMLCAVDGYHDRMKEIAIIGDLASADTQALIRTVYDRYLPNKVVVHAADRIDDPLIPLLRGKGRINGHATAYVCYGYTCKRPVTSASDLARQLAEQK